MVVGVVKEIKPAERRVALTPAGVRELAAGGASVLVEAQAGVGSGFEDEAYERAGAQLVSTAAEVWERSDLLVKVKEPIASEYQLLRPDLVLFTYLHLAADLPLIDALVESRATAIAYETVEDTHGALPLLAPMSEVAGRLATQAGAYFLQDPMGGNGTLIGGAPGVRAARVLVIGGGVVGTQATRIAVGMGAEVTVLERSLSRIRELEQQFDGRVSVLMSNRLTLEAELPNADLVIGAVLIPGAAAPHLIKREDLALLKRRSVIVDVAIDQGGCAETSRPTTHGDPVYEVDGVLHYCVANMPGAVPATSTQTLTNATLPYVLGLASHGVDGSFDADAGFAKGLNVRGGEIAYRPVKEAYEHAGATA
ncbi:MAG TPA: alanine dehydrogenase [Solirubrobacteraceae bacterium]|nr:alanine dehydrogenase [Solirubrobacteraceae bacterium]